MGRLSKGLIRKDVAKAVGIPTRILRRIERGEGHDVPFMWFPLIAFELGMVLRCELVEKL
jgi:hypothetical protein